MMLKKVNDSVLKNKTQSKKEVKIRNKMDRNLQIWYSHMGLTLVSLFLFNLLVLVDHLVLLIAGFFLFLFRFVLFSRNVWC